MPEGPKSHSLEKIYQHDFSQQKVNSKINVQQVHSCKPRMEVLFIVFSFRMNSVFIQLILFVCKLTAKKVINATMISSDIMMVVYYILIGDYI